MHFLEVQKNKKLMNLQQNQYNCIGIVAKHCDQSKLCVAENEASIYDLAELFCDFWFEIEEIEAEIKAYDNAQENKPEKPINYEEKKALLEGGFYKNCSGKKIPFEGVYSILARYSYSRYIILNGFSDTPTGVVQKTNDFSIPKSLKELEQFAEKYRNMAKISFERCLKYICQNIEIFKYSNCPDTSCDCGCDSSDCGKTKAKGFGFKIRNVSK